jgi:hypothetical protein
VNDCPPDPSPDLTLTHVVLRYDNDVIHEGLAIVRITRPETQKEPVTHEG